MTEINIEGVDYIIAENAPEHTSSSIQDGKLVLECLKASIGTTIHAKGMWEIAGLAGQMTQEGFKRFKSSDVVLRKKKVLLWIDDWRDPEHYAPQFEGETFWAKGFADAQNFFGSYGLPDRISFDYDLNDRNYNGLSCAKVFMRECSLRSMGFPDWHVHSNHPDKKKLEEWIRMECMRKRIPNTELNANGQPVKPFDHSNQ